MAKTFGKAMEVSVSRYYPGRTISALIVPQLFAQKPELTFNMEQVLIGSWDKGSMPYCTVDRLVSSGTAEKLHLELHGELDASVVEPGLRSPYMLHLSFEAEPTRVRVHGEMVKLDVPLVGYGPCLQAREFSKENLPAFEMARKSFMYFEGKGFTWLSDAERTRSERHVEPPVDEGGPWIQLFTTKPFIDTPGVVRRTTRKESAISPLVGWVANDDAYLVAVAARNAFQAGIRWGPCLHSNIACDLGEGGQDNTFDQIIYTTPVDLDLLLEMVKEDFPDLDSREWAMAEDALWPYRRGIVLNSFEGADLARWQANQGTLERYRGERLWINGNLERITFPEGVTEGSGSMLWELPAGEGDALLQGNCALHPELSGHISHLAVDAMNRGSGDIELLLTAEAGGQTVAQQSYRLHEWSNQRLLLPVPQGLRSDQLQLSFKISERPAAIKLVLDNLRVFVD